MPSTSYYRRAKRRDDGRPMTQLTDRYLSTFSGKKFFPFKPAPDQIDIRDIAHGLSLVCRFSGQTPFLYSVAEHSILVARHLPLGLRLEALLHDAAEAYLADLPGPLKSALPEYSAVETNVAAVIAHKFRLSHPIPPEVKAADRALLKHEIFAFFGSKRYFEYFGDEYQATNPKHFFGMSPITAEFEFLKLYRHLTNQAVS
jgi:hypothetical protein